MTRSQAIATIQSTLADLSGERVMALADIAKSWSRPSVFSTLSASERAELDAALDSLDRCEGVSWEFAEAELEAKL